jgi:enoyl-CoA hydratase/carnithine racemase
VKGEELKNIVLRNLEYKTISFEMIDGLGHLVLNQPPSNVMNLLFFSELSDLVRHLGHMKDLRALVISGKGRHFSSGAELDELLGLVSNGSSTNGGNDNMELQEFIDRNYNTFLFFENLTIPVISAIRGVCLGSALELALFSHFRFCGEDSVFGLPETTYKLIPGIGGISRIAALSGKAKALELVLRGNTFSAEKALQYHLVDKVLPKRMVVQFAISFARSIMMNYRKGKPLLYLKKITMIHE